MGIPSTDWKIVAKPLFRVDMVLIGFESFTNDQLKEMGFVQILTKRTRLPINSMINLENLVCLEKRGRVVDLWSGAATPKTTSPEQFDTMFF